MCDVFFYFLFSAYYLVDSIIWSLLYIDDNDLDSILFLYNSIIRVINYINQLLHCIGFYSRVFVLFLFWRGVSRVKIKTKQIRVNKIQMQWYNGFIIYVCHSSIMIRRNKALFAQFHGKLAKLKIFQAKCRLFYLILFFLLTKKYIKNKNKIKKNIFNKIIKKK